jgi:hypothetical protein
MVFPGVETQIASFEYTVENDNAELTGLTISGLDNSKISNVTVDF